MLGSLSALLTRPSALATSVALHVGVVIAGGHALSEGNRDRAGTSAPLEVEIDVAEAAPSPRLERPEPAALPDRELAQPALAATAPRARSAGHRHAYPVPTDHDAHPHDPSLVHIAGASTLPQAIVSTAAEAAPSEIPTSQAPSSDAPLHFVLGPTDVTTRGPTVSASARTGVGSSVDTGASDAREVGAFDAILTENAVDTPARLLSSVPVVYPEAARAAEVEADVLLELVVDGNGRVIRARPLTAHGFGLADSALRAVRAYRFTPAERAGRPVRVRMRWTVTFRLQ